MTPVARSQPRQSAGPLQSIEPVERPPPLPPRAVSRRGRQRGRLNLIFAAGRCLYVDDAHVLLTPVSGLDGLGREKLDLLLENQASLDACRIGVRPEYITAALDGLRNPQSHSL